MAVLDPLGDWTRRGASALDNPRSATGEPSLPSLYSLLNTLQSEVFKNPDFKKISKDSHDSIRMTILLHSRSVFPPERKMKRKEMNDVRRC